MVRVPESWSFLETCWLKGSVTKLLARARTLCQLLQLSVHLHNLHCVRKLISLIFYRLTSCSAHKLSFYIFFKLVNFKYLQSLISQSVARKLVFQWWLPHSFPCTVLLSANGADSTGKRTWLGVQSRSRAGPSRPLKSSNCELTRWSRSIRIQLYSAMKWNLGIGDEMLVSVSQTLLSRMWVFNSLHSCKHDYKCLQGQGYEQNSAAIHIMLLS